MQQQRIIHCPNCGTEFSPSPFSEERHDQAKLGYECPVCHFYVSATPTLQRRTHLSLDELETELSTLFTDAFTSGLSPDMVVNVLRNELAFAAELAHPGRRLSIQIIDLGPEETEILQRPVHDPGANRQSRSLG